MTNHEHNEICEALRELRSLVRSSLTRFRAGEISAAAHRHVDRHGLKAIKILEKMTNNHQPELTEKFFDSFEA